MLVFDISYNAASNDRETADEEAMDYARGIVWCEVTMSEQTIQYAERVGEYDGVEVWYDYGADYYFFTEDDD